MSKIIGFLLPNIPFFLKVIRILFVQILMKITVCECMNVFLPPHASLMTMNLMYLLKNYFRF